jgi:flagellar biogenesis protein FliO
MDESRPVGHETEDVSVRAILRFGVGLVVAAAIINVGLWVLFRFFQERAEKHDRRSGTTLASTRPVEAPRSP